MRQLKPDIYEVGGIDWDARMFDGLIPLPNGTSYNAYLVKGSEKTALLDAADPRKQGRLLEHLREIGVDKIDYVVSHHAEQDHSGGLPTVLEHFPMAKIVTNQKCRDMLIDLLPLNAQQFITIEDGQSLSLGNKTLEFVFTPWVHWPETISTYLAEDKILFSCDFFGSHYACSRLFVGDDEGFVYQAAKRYYAEIMMPFRKIIKNNIAKIEPLEIDMIAPSHGPVYDRPRFIVDAYKDWISDDVKNQVVLPYISMHHSTEAMVNHFTDALMHRGIEVKRFDLTEPETGLIAMALVDAATVVLGAPTMLGQAHPKAAYAALLTNALKPKTRFISVIGSYGWGGRAVKQLQGLLGAMKSEIIEPVTTKGYPDSDCMKQLDDLADAVLEKHKSIGIA